MKKLLSLIMVIAMVVSFGACKGKSSENTSSTAESKPVNMKLWIFLNPANTEDPRNVVLKEIVEEYNNTNANKNTVTVESINYAKFESQALQAAAAQTGPDIINIYTDMLKQHIAGGTVQPMTKKAEEFIATMPDYTYSANDLKINNEIYTLPWESRTFVYWYRTDIFPTAPASLDELAATAGTKTTKTALGFVIGLSDGSNGASFMESFNPMIRSAGGQLFDSNGKAVFNSDAGVKVLNFMKSLVTKNAMNNSALSLTVDNIVDAFKSGTILSCNLGTMRAATIKKSDLASKFKSAPIPGFTSGTPSPALVAGQSLGIGKFAQNADQSFDFIKTFYSEANQKKWLKANVMTVRKNIYNDAEIKALSNYDELKSWCEYASNGKVEFFPQDYSELSVKLAQAAQKVVFQNADAATQLNDVANWYNTKNNK